MRRIRRPGPRAIDPISGFDVPHSNLVRQYDGEFVDKRFADKQNPQDFIRPRAEQINLPNARPEPAEVGIAAAIMWEDFSTPIFTEDGSVILSEGIIP